MMSKDIKLNKLRKSKGQLNLDTIVVLPKYEDNGK